MMLLRQGFRLIQCCKQKLGKTYLTIWQMYNNHLTLSTFTGDFF